MTGQIADAAGRPVKGATAVMGHLEDTSQVVTPWIVRLR